LARSPEWIEEAGVTVGATISVDLPEMGLHGPAKVVAISPCLPLPPGKGALITGVFEHQADKILDIQFEGSDERIGVTPGHAFRSEDRQDFVLIGEFHIGERVRTRDGRVVPLTSVIPRAGPATVYNIEVHGEHVFHVGTNSLLVHNSSVAKVNIDTGTAIAIYIAKLTCKTRPQGTTRWSKNTYDRNCG
jgi:hypothetical protein